MFNYPYSYCLNGNCDRQDRPFNSRLVKQKQCPWCLQNTVQNWTETVPEYMVYTDGSCPQNVTGGPGGWAAVFVKGYHDPLNPPAYSESLIHHIESGYEELSTNNRMEIGGVLAAVHGFCLPTYSKLIICSDSQYTINGFSTWVHGWPAKDWRSGKNPVKNRDLWETALEALKAHHHDVRFVWVRGHAGHVFNELADKVAGESARSLTT